jgi:hypothetical protein
MESCKVRVEAQQKDIVWTADRVVKNQKHFD